MCLYRDDNTRETEEQHRILAACTEGGEGRKLPVKSSTGLAEMALGFILDGVSSQMFYTVTSHTSRQIDRHKAYRYVHI